MSKTIVNALLLLLVLVPAQAVIFNNLAVFGVALPLVFIYVLITLPVTTGANLVLTIGFLSGLAVDVFSDTPGLNALACTVLAFMRRPVLHLYLPLDDDCPTHSCKNHAGIWYSQGVCRYVWRRTRSNY